MRLTLSALICMAAVGFAAPSFAQTASSAKPVATTAKQTSTSTAKAASKSTAKPATVRANGKLTSFDSSNMMLMMSGPKGSQQFTLASSTKIEEGSKTIDGATLQKLTGHDVTVSYSETGGQKIVQSVHVSSAAPKKS